MIASDGTTVIEEVTTTASRIRPRPIPWGTIVAALGAAVLLSAILYGATKR